MGKVSFSETFSGTITVRDVSVETWVKIKKFIADAVGEEEKPQIVVTDDAPVEPESSDCREAVWNALDEATRRAVKSGDIAALRSLDGTYLDCPEALSVLLLRGQAEELAYRSLVYLESGLPVGASYFLYGVFS